MFPRVAVIAFLTAVFLFGTKVEANCVAGDCEFVVSWRYMTYEEINFHLDYLDANVSTINVHTIGQTAEGKDIKLININTDPSNVKHSIYMQGGTRGNEWLSVSTALNFAQKFRLNSWLTGGLNISIVPLVNPDGYIYSQLTDRTWSKNRATSSSSTCVGVNLGRNWDTDWGVSNSSTNACNSNFAGTAAFSEHETSAIKNAIDDVDNFKLAVDFQGSGRRILYPYNFVKTSVNPPDNLTTIIRSANDIADDAAVINGNSYLVENGAAINQASGTASDFAIEKGIDYAYTIETTTDDERWASRITDNILPTKHELWAGLKPLILKIRDMD